MHGVLLSSGSRNSSVGFLSWRNNVSPDYDYSLFILHELHEILFLFNRGVLLSSPCSIDKIGSKNMQNKYIRIDRNRKIDRLVKNNENYQLWCPIIVRFLTCLYAVLRLVGFPTEPFEKSPCLRL